MSNKTHMKWLLAYGNKKYKKYGRKLLTFGLPAFKSRTGLITCPGAGKCFHGCYAQQGWYRSCKVRDIQEGRLRATRNKNFLWRMVAEIQARKPKFVRIHDSGDFYSEWYLMEWIRIAQNCSQTFFFTYSKAVPWVKLFGLPTNMKIVLSEGGIYDSWIKPRTDLMARVFDTRKQIRASGFSDGSNDDLALILKGHRNIGLIYHGWKSRKFTTGGNHAKST